MIEQGWDTNWLTCGAQALDGEGGHEQADAQLERRRIRFWDCGGVGTGGQVRHHGNVELVEQQLEAAPVEAGGGLDPAGNRSIPVTSQGIVNSTFEHR